MSVRMALLLAVLPAALQAQGADSSRLTLARAVSIALERSPGVAGAGQRLAASEGELLSARGAFGTRLTSSTGQTRSTERRAGGDGAVSTQPTVVAGSYQVGVEKQFRSGVTVQPTLLVARSTVDAAGAVSTNQATVGVQMRLPLWHDRGGALQRVPERAAAARHEHARLSTGHAAAVSVLDAASAYWQLAAARERAEVQRLSERRAERMAEETRVMVEAGERPAADLNQLLANVAAKRVARIAAEQGVRQARRALGLALGLDAAEIATLSDVTDPFPTVREVELDSAGERRLVEVALESRGDLAAARGGEHTAEMLLRASRAALKPRLDLTFSAGYTGMEKGAGMGALMAPLYQNLPGLNTSVFLEYRLPLGNADGRGQVMQRAASLEQERIQRLDLHRRVASGVALAVQGVRSSVSSAAEADRAVDLYRAAVDNERTRRQLDAATLLDVILAEDALTSALLAQVAARLGYALALAQLRYESGSLATLDEGRPTADAAHLVTLPAPGAAATSAPRMEP